MNEYWADVRGYEGLYQISDQGEVMRIGGGRGAVVGRILQPAPTMGYPGVVLCIDSKPKTHRIHRLVAEAFVPNPGGKPDVNHKDGDRMNNAASNLEWVTASENSKHAFDVLGVPIPTLRGEKHGNAKLTRADVIQIRKLYAAGSHTQQQLGNIFGVARCTIGFVVRREHWAHV